MTSSLVGSEMCIRDRYIYLPGTEHIDCSHLREDWVKMYVIQFMLGSEAVSYTHLTLPTICSV
eukprot:12477174-Prorocentrum_lima.AAC.1